jgi:hypothetical protein
MAAGSVSGAKQPDPPFSILTAAGSELRQVSTLLPGTKASVLDIRTTFCTTDVRTLPALNLPKRCNTLWLTPFSLHSVGCFALRVFCHHCAPKIYTARQATLPRMMCLACSQNLPTQAVQSCACRLSASASSPRQCFSEKSGRDPSLLLC